MDCETAEITKKSLNQFKKIRLLNSMANSIAYYGEDCGVTGFVEALDLKCGAIPEGDFGNVIDLNSPNQFLSLYMHVAENRFAFAVSQLIKINPAFFTPIHAFCKETGKLNKEPIASIYDAFELYESIVLDGMYFEETKEVVIQKNDKIVWKKKVDSHESAWAKYDGDLKNFYEMLKAFVEGLFEDTPYNFEIDESFETFTIFTK